MVLASYKYYKLCEVSLCSGVIKGGREGQLPLPVGQGVQNEGRQKEKIEKIGKQRMRKKKREDRKARNKKKTEREGKGK